MVEIVVALNMEYMVFSIPLHILSEKQTNKQIKNHFNQSVPASKRIQKNLNTKIKNLTNQVDNNNFVYIVHSYKSIQSKNFQLLEPLILKLHHLYYQHQAIHYNVKTNLFKKKKLNYSEYLFTLRRSRIFKHIAVTDRLYEIII